MRRLRPIDEELLAAVAREIERLRAVDLIALSKAGVDRDTLGRLRGLAGNARRGIVPADFRDLLGRALSDAELKQCQRSAERLESLGRLRRLRGGFDGAVVTHLQLVEDASAAETADARPTATP